MMNIIKPLIMIEKIIIYIDPRLFFITQFSDDEKYIKEFIEPILYRICSIHNELGDRFTVGEGKDAEDYDLIKNYFHSMLI